jgi:hypothetical protein
MFGHLFLRIFLIDTYYMRARTVNENISFTKGLDPKKSMGIGINPYNEKPFCKYIIGKLPEILGTVEVPEDIIRSSSNYINMQYNTDLINTYLRNLLSEYSIDPCPPGSGDYWVTTETTLGYNIWSSLRSVLMEMGYSTS